MYVISSFFAILMWKIWSHKNNVVMGARDGHQRTWWIGPEVFFRGVQGCPDRHSNFLSSYGVPGVDPASRRGDCDHGGCGYRPKRYAFCY